MLTVNAPGGPRSCIDAFIADTRGVSSARLRAGTTVDANLEAHIVNLVCKTGYAIWESVRIGDELLGVAVTAILYRPAVVEIDILITGILT